MAAAVTDTQRELQLSIDFCPSSSTRWMKSLPCRQKACVQQRDWMGGNIPSRFSDEEEGGGITFLKGIRLSDRVINRMKHSSTVNSSHSPPEPQTPVTMPVPVPLLLPQSTPPQEARPTAPSVECVPPVKLILPPPVKFHSLPPASVESAGPNTPLSVTPPSPQVEPPVMPESVIPPPEVKSEVLPPAKSIIPPYVEPETSTTPQTLEQTKSPVVLLPAMESSRSSTTCELGKPAVSLEPAASSSFSPAETFQLPPAVEPVISSSPVCSAPAEASAFPSETEPTLTQSEVSSSVAEEVPPTTDVTSPPPADPPAALSLTLDPLLDKASSQCQCENLSVIPTDAPVNNAAPVDKEPDTTTFLPPADEDEACVFNTPPPPATDAALPISPELLEEELRQKIKTEMQRSLEEEINQRRQELQQQLEEVRVQARAEADAAAQVQVEQQVKATLEAEKAAYMEKLTESIAKEKIKAEDEKLMVQLYWMELKSHQLEEKEKEMKKRDALYKEHVAKLEAKHSEFYKVSAKNFQKGKDETHKRFRRFNIQPVCGDLQSQILKCYKENPGKTLSCSRIASAYIQCVDNAKKVQIQT